ncbi:MAG TPA: nucleoside-diphosphate kinase [Sediminispirochaeta sp.]|nr:nucleoside-diphosphate kinase [Sediminispirochaeta sp.]
MNEELSYILVTPYTIAKSRTGGVISRLLSRLDLELVGAQMFAPTKEFAEKYAEIIRTSGTFTRQLTGELLSNYVLENFSPSTRRHRVLLMLFRGENATRKLSDIAGAIYPENRGLESITGETIRDTYADLIMDPEDPNKVRYFEPAVLTPRNQETALKTMRLFADFIKDEPTVIENMVYKNPKKIERTLVIIKPDNWRYASSRPGTIIDMFSRTGLRVISVKVHRMSVAEALEFYGPVKNVLRDKLAPVFGQKASEVLEREFNMEISDQTLRFLTESFGVEYAEDQFDQIIEFMSGRKSKDVPVDELNQPGSVKCMALVYEGENAVQRIREVLGPTDPTKAPGGTVRREFGQDVMVNTAHASDAPDSAEREMKVIKIQSNNCHQILDAYLKSVEG